MEDNKRSGTGARSNENREKITQNGGCNSENRVRTNINRTQRQRPNEGQRLSEGQRSSEGQRLGEGQRRSGGQRPRSESSSQDRARKKASSQRSQEAKKRMMKKRRRKVRATIAGMIVFIAMLVAIGGFFYLEKYGLSKEEMSLNKYYEVVSDEEMAVIIDNEVIGVEGKLIDGVPYISYEAVRNNINSRFYWDFNENILLYTLEDGTVRADVGANYYTKGQEKMDTSYPVVKAEGADAYIAAEFVQIFSNIEYATFDNPNRIVVTATWGEVETALIRTDTQIRYQGGVKSPILTHVAKNDRVVILEQGDEWSKVCSTDGVVGYVKVSSLKDQKVETISREFEEQVYSNITKDYTINMAWHQVTNSSVNTSVLQTLAQTKGLTTIAPTWFFIDDVDGNLKSLASESYVNYAHQSNIEVWAVINDFDGGIGSQSETFEVLSYTSKREKIINQLIAEALKTGVDGINVDIEHVSLEAGVHYIQFIRELSVKCRQNELVLSVDNYPPKAYNMHFDYEEQGIVADYVVIMGYDEHFGGSLEAGPVASIGYVKSGIEEMLTMVPSNKVINAMPFYSRLWEQTPKTAEELAEQEGTEEAEYPMNVSSKTYGMVAAMEVVADAGVTPVWDEETQTNYATWTIDDTIYEIWIEDAQSIEEKLKLMKENDLAGVASWKLGLESENIWNVIQRYVN